MSPFFPGAVLGGRYELEQCLSNDGLTEQWGALDRVLVRPVVIEALAPEAGAGAHDAFVAAVAATARLVHPGIVATYDSGVVMPEPGGGADPAVEPGADDDPHGGGAGLPYVVTERPAGPTLAETIEHQGPIAAGRVVAVGQQSARALEAAHRLGVSHGAVSPSTVLLSEDDRVKLARFAASGARARLAGADARAPGTVTPPVADVRALATTLVGALLGSTPSGEPPGTRAAVSPRALRPGVPRALDQVLVAAQDGSLDDAGRLAATLEGLDIADDAEPAIRRQRTPPRGAAAVSTPSRRGAGAGRRAGVLAALLLVVAVAVAAVVLSGVGPSHRTAPGGGPAGPRARGPSGGLAITGGHSFNPLSPDDPQKHEQEQLVPHLYDGDPASEWSTFEYGTARFGNIKSGTGVYVALGRVRALHQLTVTSPSRGWTFLVYAADQPGADLASWGHPIGSPSPVTVTTDRTRVDLGGVRGADVLVWITDLGSPLVPPDDPVRPYRVDIGELAVR